MNKINPLFKKILWLVPLFAIVCANTVSADGKYVAEFSAPLLITPVWMLTLNYDRSIFYGSLDEGIKRVIHQYDGKSMQDIKPMLPVWAPAKPKRTVYFHINPKWRVIRLQNWLHRKITKNFSEYYQSTIYLKVEKKSRH